MNKDKRRLYALLGTVLLHGAVLVVLLTVFLRYVPSAETEEKTWPPVDSAEILFGGEYVVMGDPRLTDPGDAAPAEAAAAEPSESPEPPAAAEPPVSTDRPSPAKVEKNPTNTGKKIAQTHTASDDAEARRAAEEKKKAEERRRQDAASAAANSRVSGAFSGSKGGGGQPNGNAQTGKMTGDVGANVRGRTLAKWSSATSTSTGTITVDVVVNRQGAVTSASYNPGKSKGAAAANTAARQSCISAAKKCRFSVATDGPDSQRGTISFRFH